MNFIRSHFGYYEVNGRRYTNKISALASCKNKEWPTWNFNEDAFSKFNWCVEPAEDLYEIYKKRAQQLRQKYDKLILFFSGGIDSINILRAFVDNNIELDAIVSYGCFSLFDAKSQLRNLEIYNAAIPYIKELQKHHNKKLNYFLVDDWKHFLKFDDESWVQHSGISTLRPESYSFNFFHEYDKIRKIMEQGSTCLIRGIDKPRVIYDQDMDKWSVRFLDKQLFGTETPGLSEETNSWYNVEYFYWTPDMPEIICKQAHLIKRHFQTYDKAFLKQYFTLGDVEFDSLKYYDYIDPVIYSRYLTQKIGEKKNYYHLGKGGSFDNAPDITGNFITVKDTEFFKFADERNIEVWLKGVKNVFNSIDDMYRDGKDLRSFIKEGFVGIWSKSYDID